MSKVSVRRVVGLSCVFSLALAASVMAQTSVPVTWTNLVHDTVAGVVLQKTSGCDGCQDGGATSLDSLAGDGYVEFTVGDATTMFMAGLSHGNTDTTYSDIDFGLRFNGGGWADTLEDGAYQGGDTPYVAGDVFRIAVVLGEVQYFKNGHLLRESTQVPVFPLIVDTSMISMNASVQNALLGVNALPPPPPPPQTGAGFLEKDGSPALRARFTAAQIQAFLPAGGAKGSFTFPAPYNSTAVRLTDATDCAGGTDCVWYDGYAYWSNINNHVASNDMYIFLGFDTQRGGAGPSLIKYNKLTDTAQNLGSMFDANNASWRYSTGEGWYFSATQATKLYTWQVGGTKLLRYDILTRTFDATPAMDIAACPRPSVCPSTTSTMTQPHSSDNDLVHSATIQNGDWARIGCVVSSPAGFLYYPTPAGYSFDECSIDKSGRWLILLQGTAAGARVNRIVDIQTGSQTVIDAVNGALGHYDMGYGYAVGADPYNAEPNATILLKFPVVSTQRPIGPVVQFNKRWDLVATNHIAHGNGMSGASPESQYACGSNASQTADMADEIVCYSLNSARNLDGSLDTLVVGQVMTDFAAAGGGAGTGYNYEKSPKGNLDVTGRYFIWTTNTGSNRLDAFIVKVPAEKLTLP